MILIWSSRFDFVLMMDNVNALNLNSVVLGDFNINVLDHYTTVIGNDYRRFNSVDKSAH